ncbi:hypothetical protein WR25_16673 [Diploscapter pachys]|uniref:Zinc finger double-stranded RNA binding domain-containing protein n=1 Tax=Diploscapter pachys TaxID=2018661 RepID=A0A2A2LU18_9BILA|nr:hypothetical protein WR25_16673 [Diploscapter pachys]
MAEIPDFLCEFMRNRFWSLLEKLLHPSVRSYRGKMRENPAIFVIGCTGTGKSDLGVAIAKQLNGEVISADSMQFYKGLDIATNKITPEEAEAIPHHMMNFLDPSTSSYNVHLFRKSCLEIIEEMRQKGRVPVIVGGTTYYLESLLFDDNIIPTGSHYDGKSEKMFRDELEELSNDELYEYLKKVDPDWAQHVHPNNRLRVLRAIEIYLSSGKRKSEFLAEQGAGGKQIGGKLRWTNSLVLFLDADTNVLEQRLDKRVEKMIAAGLKDEVHGIYEKYSEHLQSEEYGVMQCIGLKEFMPYLKLSSEERTSDEGSKRFEQGCELMKLRTRQYSRKQRHWFDNRLAVKRRPDAQVPIVRKLDTSDKNTFISEGLNIVKQWMQGDEYTEVKGVTDDVQGSDGSLMHYCEICDRRISGRKSWESHVNGKNHKYLRSQKKRMEEEKLRKERESQQKEEDKEAVAN